MYKYKVDQLGSTTYCTTLLKNRLLGAVAVTKGSSLQSQTQMQLIVTTLVWLSLKEKRVVQVFVFGRSRHVSIVPKSYGSTIS